MNWHIFNVCFGVLDFGLSFYAQYKGDYARATFWLVLGIWMLTR